MKKSARDDIRQLSAAELGKKAAELRKKITDEGLKRLTSQVKNVHAVKNLRRELALVLSVRRIKALSEKKE